MNKIPLLNRLSVRISCAVFLLMLASFVLLYHIAVRALADFSEAQAQRELSEIGRQLRTIAERYHEQSLQAHGPAAESARKKTQSEALRDLSTTMRSCGIQGAVFERGTAQLMEAPALGSALKKAVGSPSGAATRLSVGDRSYHLLNQHFSPWEWEIVLAQDVSSAAAMMHRLRTIYLVIGGILLGTLALIFLFVHHAIRVPMETITSAIERGQRPSYRGTHEFETLSTSLAKLLDEKDRLVHQLLQDQIMENLRVTTRGVVHNFNNILVGALGYASLGKMKLESAIRQNLPLSDKVFDDILKYIESIEQAAERAGSLARKLSSIAQTRSIGAGNFVRSDVNTVLQELQPIIRTILPRDTEFVMNLAEGLPPVRADNMQLEQALLNLCINSRDAMQENGVLTIASRAVSFGRGKMVHPLQTAGSYVVIDVRDTGEGMDQATLARIFEPFFTTKPMDQGTGLGLTMVDMIMKAHNGFVLCESTPGTGTTFTLYFPAETS